MFELSAADIVCDPPGFLQLKSAAAGLMAIAFQVAHFLGLAVATLAALLMYGHVGPHEH